ncbi:unnamed protein product [Paramecium pentaurelia]|uniref:Uncharacterized protein n=1 Tax=Paramecium pentaurelia TaxID=43138 RepID=A0A8S1VWC5_9CILI|nr:unnamed protein product [Paramecium pentaurelia]
MKFFQGLMRSQLRYKQDREKAQEAQDEFLEYVQRQVYL